MIIWLIMFLFVLTVSAILAFRAIKQYQEDYFHLWSDCSPFLVRNLQALDGQFLNQTDRIILRKGERFSLEKLIKGERQAWVIFGPRRILAAFTDSLGLVELEDYSQNYLGGRYQYTACWEAAVERSESIVFNEEGNAPPLAADEQCWWQINVLPVRGFKKRLEEIISGVYHKNWYEESRKFEIGIRVVLLTSRPQTVKQWQSYMRDRGRRDGIWWVSISTLDKNGLYQARKLSADQSKLKLGSWEILSLLNSKKTYVTSFSSS